MRTYEEYRRILELWEAGENKKAIARITGIPRATVRGCIARYTNIQGLEDNRERATPSVPDGILNRIQCEQHSEVQEAYAYLLGIYLGDGYIVRNKRVYFLRISLDGRYPEIIQQCVSQLKMILPDHKVNVLKMRAGNWVEVVCTYKFWPEIFPQHGSGYKHQRQIKLESWQQQIVDTYPLAFWRGLYHSDGSRFRNVVNGTDYPRYSFTNQSEDICGLFSATCDRLGIHWTFKRRQTARDHAIDILISKRADVAYLDQVVGPKT